MSGTLLERDRSLAELEAWLRAVPERGGCIALIHGEAGIGKSTMLREFANRRRDMTILWGGCDDLFTPQPLAPLHDIARQTQGPLLTALHASGHRHAIFSAVMQELERAPTLIVFEDIHWADEATLDLLKYLGRRIGQTKAMLAVTYRDNEVGARHPLRFVIGDLPRARTRKFELPPLSETAVAALAANSVYTARSLHTITGGNPLFVTEILAAGGDGIPASVRDAVLTRAVRLAPASRALAEFVCVIPGKAESWLLDLLVRPDDAAVEGCLAIGMRHLPGGSLAFRHELVRRALEDSLAGAHKARLHALILDALAARPDVPAARLAHHADGAQAAQQVLHFAPLAAAQAASVGAHREAVAHYEAALRHGALLMATERARLHENLSYEYYLTDRADDAVSARQAALDTWRALASRLDEGNALRWMSRLSWFIGRGAEADRYAIAAVTALETVPPGRELAMAYSNRAQLRMLAYDAAAAIQWAERAITLAERLGDAEILCHALNNRGTAKLTMDDEAGSSDLLRSLDLALEHGYQEHVARAYTNLSATALSGRRYGPAATYFSDGLAYCERYDLDSWRVYMLALRSRARVDQGDWHGASEDIDGVLQYPRTATISRLPALTSLGLLRIRRGDPDAWSPLEQARELADLTGELQRIGPVAVAYAEGFERFEQHDRLLGYIRAAYDLAGRQGDKWIKGELAAFLWRMGELSKPPTEIAAPYALEIAGEWRRSAESWLRLGCRYEYARVLQRNGPPAQQLEALAVFDDLGAAPAAQALRKSMRDVGVLRVPRGARPSTRNDRFGLTRRESQILGLMATGLRNSAIAKKLFVSTRTVDHHVSAILAKLGVKSRQEAVVEAQRQDGAPPTRSAEPEAD